MEEQLTHVPEAACSQAAQLLCTVSLVGSACYAAAEGLIAPFLSVQEAQGVVFAAFELKVDTLMSLRLNWTDLLPLYKSVAEDQPDILSVVVFR